MAFHNTSTKNLDSGRISQVIRQNKGNLVEILTELGGIALGTLISALKKFDLTDELDLIKERTRELALNSDGLESIANETGVGTVSFWRYRNEIGLTPEIVHDIKRRVLVEYRTTSWLQSFDPNSSPIQGVAYLRSNRTDVNVPLTHLVSVLYAAKAISPPLSRRLKYLAGSVDIFEREVWARELLRELSKDKPKDPFTLIDVLRGKRSRRIAYRYLISGLEFFAVIPSDDTAIDYRFTTSQADYYENNRWIQRARKFESKLDALAWLWNKKIKSRVLPSFKYLMGAIGADPAHKVPRGELITYMSVAAKADYVFGNKRLFEEEILNAYRSLDISDCYNRDGSFSTYRFMCNLFRGVNKQRFLQQGSGKPISRNFLRESFSYAMRLFGLSLLEERYPSKKSVFDQVVYKN